MELILIALATVLYVGIVAAGVLCAGLMERKRDCGRRRGEGKSPTAPRPACA